MPRTLLIRPAVCIGKSALPGSTVSPGPSVSVGMVEMCQATRIAAPDQESRISPKTRYANGEPPFFLMLGLCTSMGPHAMFARNNRKSWLCFGCSSSCRAFHVSAAYVGERGKTTPHYCGWSRSENPGASCGRSPILIRMIS